ncbi:MAG: GHKL domain-containing protein [Clostridiales bacterium]|nr:GHKL domain-containing protein [Clostridiales bacterium]
MNTGNIIICFLIISATIGIASFYLWLHRKENEILQNNIAVMRELYDTLQNQIDLARKFRHDLAKHVQTLEFLLRQDQQNVQMRECIEELKLKVQKSKSQKYCMDEIINAIVVTEQRRCEEKGIPIKIHVEQEDYDIFQEFDKVGLIYNLLDNAIEANERIPSDPSAKGYVEKRIHFTMEKKEGKICILTENSVASGEIITFRTRKKKKSEHGIGTQIIEQIVKNYHGTKDFTYDAEKHCVRQRLQFPVELT